MIRATARIQIVVEVEAAAWGADCTIGQLHKQAAESARATLTSALKPGAEGHTVRVIGEPKVIGILTEANA